MTPSRVLPWATLALCRRRELRQLLRLRFDRPGGGPAAASSAASATRRSACSMRSTACRTSCSCCSGGVLVDRFGASRVAEWTGACACSVHCSRRSDQTFRRWRPAGCCSASGPRRSTSRRSRPSPGICGLERRVRDGAHDRDRPGRLVLGGHVARLVHAAYAQGWQPPLMIAAGIAATFLLGSLRSTVDRPPACRAARREAVPRPFGRAT